MQWVIKHVNEAYSCGWYMKSILMWLPFHVWFGMVYLLAEIGVHNTWDNIKSRPSHISVKQPYGESRMAIFFCMGWGGTPTLSHVYSHVPVFSFKGLSSAAVKNLTKEPPLERLHLLKIISLSFPGFLTPCAVPTCLCEVQLKLAFHLPETWIKKI